MNLIKYSIKNYRSNISLNLLLLLQMTVMLFVLTYSLYAFHSKYKYFTAFGDILQGEGVLADIESMLYDGSVIIDSDTLEQFYGLEEFRGAYGTYTVFAEIEGCDTVIRAYDSEIIEKFIPDMAEGHWLNKEGESEDYLNVVVSENEYGFGEGDYLDIICNGASHQARIVGVLEKNAAVFSKDPNCGYEENYRDMYWNYSSDYEQKLLILLSEEQLAKTDLFYMLSGPLLVCYNNSITEEQKADNLLRLCNAGYIIYSTSFTSLWRNSWDVLKTELYTFVPISVLLLLITIFTSIQISRINLVRTLKNFAVYYMMGCSWRKCKRICIISSLWSMLAAIIVNHCVWLGFMLTDKIEYDGMLIKYMNWLYLCAAMLYLTVILLYQNALLGRYTPYQIMRGDNND